MVPGDRSNVYLPMLASTQTIDAEACGVPRPKVEKMVLKRCAVCGEIDSQNATKTIFASRMLENKKATCSTRAEKKVLNAWIKSSQESSGWLKKRHKLEGRVIGSRSGSHLAADDRGLQEQVAPGAKITIQPMSFSETSHEKSASR